MKVLKNSVSFIVFIFLTSIYSGCQNDEYSPYNVENLSSLSIPNVSENLLDETKSFKSKKNENLNVKITKIKDEELEIVRKVEIIKNDITIAIMYASVISSSSIKEQLANNTFTGHFTIKNNSEKVLYDQVVIDNGYAQKTFSDFMTLAAEDKCSFTYIHDCVAAKIENMNPFEYALCLITAPECYAGLWLICSWDCSEYHWGE